MDILNGQRNVIVNLDKALANGDRMYLCSIVYYEVMRGYTTRNEPRKLRRFLTFWEQWSNLQLDMNAIEKAIEIYGKTHHQQLPDNDVYIAAIALVNNCTIVTADNHFNSVEDLKLVNWRD